jgi:MFS family permease
MVSQELGHLPQTKVASYYGYVIVISAFSILFVMYAVHYSYGVFFKPVLDEFGWTRATMSGAFSLSSIIMGLLGIAMGVFTDKFGPRMVMTICGLLIGLGYFLMSQLNAAWQLYLFFGIIVGIGMGGSFIPLMSTIARWFVEKRGTMTGIVTAGIGIGALIGPPVANRLITEYGWRVSYMILGSAVLVLVVLPAQFMKRDPTKMGHTAYGEHEGEQKQLKQETEAFSLGEAVVTKQFWMIFGMFFSLGYPLFAIMVHIAPHAIELGVSSTSAARILATIGGVSIIGKVLIGRVSDITGSRQTYLIGLILLSIAIFWLVPAKMAWTLYTFAGIFGLAYGGCVVSQSPLVANLFGLGSHGMILGVIGIGFTGGGALGPLLTGYMFDVIGNYQLAFLICAGISSGGIILTAVLKPIKGK